MKKRLDLFGQLFLTQKVPFSARAFLARTAVVDIFAAAFLYLLFGGNGATAVHALCKITKWKGMFLHFLRPTSLRQNSLHRVKKFLCNQRLVRSLKNFPFVFHQSGVEDVLEDFVYVRHVNIPLQIAFQSNVLAPLRHLLKRVFSGRIHLEHLSYFRRFVGVYVNAARLGIVEIAEGCKHRPDAVADFLPHASRHILTQVIHIVFALAESNLEHEQALWCRFKPEGWKFEGTNQAAIHHVDYFASVYTVAG